MSKIREMMSEHLTLIREGKSLKLRVYTYMTSEVSAYSTHDLKYGGTGTYQKDLDKLMQKEHNLKRSTTKVDNKTSKKIWKKAQSQISRELGNVSEYLPASFHVFSSEKGLPPLYVVVCMQTPSST